MLSNYDDNITGMLRRARTVFAALFYAGTGVFLDFSRKGLVWNRGKQEPSNLYSSVERLLNHHYASRKIDWI
jgi:hypothetical protein